MKIKTVIYLSAILTILPVLNACNTMEGLGQDMQQGGQDLENSADKHK